MCRSFGIFLLLWGLRRVKARSELNRRKGAWAG